MAARREHLERNRSLPRGRAFYSRDREAMRAADVSGGRIETMAEYRREKAGVFRDLRSIPWDSLREGDVLAPWDMVWVQANGRIEIEMLGATA